MKTFRFRVALLTVFASLLFTKLSLAHDKPAPSLLSVDEFAHAVGMELTADVRAEKISDNFYVFFGAGGNVAVSIGEQGVLIVDDLIPRSIPSIRKKIRELGGTDIDFVINTHWHFDHADGNKVLGEEGTWIVAHANSRDMMQSDQLINMVHFVYTQQGHDQKALPVISFDENMQFHFNGERIDLMHFGPAHTAGDAAVIFRGKNIVHTGDVYVSATYPFIDADNGGSLRGLIQFAESVLNEINTDTVVVPGHGEVVGYSEFAEYIETLKILEQRITALVLEGLSLDEIIAANPTKEFDAKMGNSSMFLNRAYSSLKRE